MKEMKSQLKWLATATCAAVLSVYAWATPVASWNNFASPTSGEWSESGPSAVTFVSGDYTLTIQGTYDANTRAVTLSAPARITKTGDGLGVFAVIADFASSSSQSGDVLTFANSTQTGKLSWDGSTLNLGYSGYAYPTKASWTGARTVMSLAHGNGAGTYAYREGFQVLGESALKWSNATFGTFTIGMNEMKVYGIYVCTGNTLSNINVTSESREILGATLGTSETPVELTRTVNGKENKWSTGWTDDITPKQNDSVRLTATDAATLTMDGLAMLNTLTVDGEGSLSFAASTDGNFSTLLASTTAIDADTDISAITANLGAVTLASGKTLTVKSLAQASSLSTSSATLVTTGDTALAARSSLLSGITNLIVSGGTFSSSLGGQSALATGRNITVTGSGSNLLLAVGDGTGWGSAGPGIRVENGGTLTFASRDTLKTPITLCGGTMTCSENAAGTSGRALDFFNANGNVVTVEAMETGSVEVPTTSSITVASTGDNAKLAIRGGALTFNVADRAKLVVSGSLISRYKDGGTPGAVTKSGDGVLELTAANTFDKGLTISGGRVLVTGDGTLGTGTVTVNEGKTLEVQVDAATKTIANTISGSGTVKKSGAGTLSLTGTVSAPVTVSAGTLKLGASVPSGSITVAGGRLEMSLPSSEKTVTAEGSEGTLVLILTDAQVAAGNLTTQLSWTGDVSKVEVRNSNGALLSRTVSKVNESDVLMLTVGAASTRRWVSGSASWDAGLSGFALGDNVDFGSNDASEAITVPVKTTVGAMTVSGTYAFSLSPGGLTATTITVAGSAKATFTPLAVNYVRLTMANPNTAGNPPALAELQLMKGGEVVQWPRGTTIQQVNRDGTTVAPNWTSDGNEAVNALIDGVWDGQATYTNPENGDPGTYNGGAGNNKWWPTTSPDAYAVIHLGAAIDFDGYQLRAADHNPRSPKDWSLEASADGTTWAVVDSQADRTIPAARSLYVYEGSNTIFPVAPMAVSAPIVVESNGTLGGSAKITGNVTFKISSILDATTEQPLEITGTVTATGTEDYPAGQIMVTLPENAVVWPVLKTTTEGLAAKLFHYGYEFHYREGTYWAVRTAAKTVTAEVTEAGALSNLTWTQDADKSKVVARADLLKLWDFALNDLSATLNTTTAAAVTIDCATVPALTLSGTAAVTLSAANEVTPTIASLTVAADSTVAAALLNCVTGSTTVESGKTLTLSGTDVSLTKLPTGTGSVKIPDGSSVTYENGDGAYSGRTTVEGTLTLACELGFAQDGSANPTYPIDIAQGGTVTLANEASTYRSFRGKGDIEVTGDATLGIPGAASVVGGFAVTGNVRVNSGATLKVTSWTSNAVLSGANFQVEGQVTQDVYGFSLTVAANTTLSGTGTIAVPVVFADGSVIEASTSGAVTCSDEVTLPETGAVTVQATAYGAKVLKKSGLNVAKFVLPTEAGASNWKTEGLFTEKDGALLLVAKPTFTPPEGTPEMSDETTRRIAELAAASDRYGITTVEVAAGRNPAAVELFDNVMEVADTTATITYDFGVSQITVKKAQLDGDDAVQSYVLACAKVSNGKTKESAADYAKGTTVSLLLDGTKATGAVALNAATLSNKFGLTAGLGEQWFALPMKNLKLGTRKFTVHATNTPQAEVTP